MLETKHQLKELKNSIYIQEKKSVEEFQNNLKYPQKNLKIL
jgi:hypothetical protein